MAGQGQTARKQPWLVAKEQDWTNQWVISQHTEALYLHGEPALFTLMWRAQDHKAGLVELCSECMGSRSAKAFDQPRRKKCPTCFGTTFEGGIRGQLIRPALFSDRNIELTDTVRGTVAIDTLQIETTTDFLFQKGDYVFRADGSRYQGEEKGEAVLRTGFALPQSNETFRGTIPSVRLEDPTSVAYTLPPDQEDLIAMLRSATSEDLTGMPGLPTSSPMRVWVFNDLATWIAPHNLNVRVPGTVVVTDMDDDAMLVAPDFISDNEVRVEWPRPMSGKIWVKA